MNKRCSVRIRELRSGSMIVEMIPIRDLLAIVDGEISRAKLDLTLDPVTVSCCPHLERWMKLFMMQENLASDHEFMFEIERISFRLGDTIGERKENTNYVRFLKRIRKLLASKIRKIDAAAEA